MPILVNRADIVGIASTVEATVEGNGEKERNPIELIVPEESESLLITVVGIGPDGYRRGPRDASVTLVDPEGRTRDDLQVTGAQGQRIFYVNEPARGRWTLTIDSGSEGAAVINTSIVPREARTKMARLGGYLRCQVCKVSLKAFAVALFALVAAPLAAGLGLSAAIIHGGAAAAAVVDAIVKFLGITRGALDIVFDNVREFANDPIDRFLERCCRVGKLCPQ